jgi:hypothetical protein
MAEQTLSSTGRAPMALTLVTASITATMIGWAQAGPGFDWDGAAASWVRDTVPYLTEGAALVTWPLGAKWPFAAAILALVLLLGVLGHQRPAVFALASVAGGLLMDWCFGGLLTSLTPETATLLYGSAFGGLALGLTGTVGRRGAIALWVLASAAVVLACLASVAAGGLISAAAMSLLLTASWLMALRQLAGAS